MTTFVVPVISFDESSEDNFVDDAFTAYNEVIQGGDVEVIYPMDETLVKAFNQDWEEGEQGYAMATLFATWEFFSQDDMNTLSIIFPSTAAKRDLSSFDAGPKTNLENDADLFVKARGKDVYTTALEMAQGWLSEDEDGEDNVHVLFIGEPSSELAELVGNSHEAAGGAAGDILMYDEESRQILPWENGPAEIDGDDEEDDDEEDDDEEDIEYSDGAAPDWAEDIVNRLATLAAVVDHNNRMLSTLLDEAKPPVKVTATTKRERVQRLSRR